MLKATLVTLAACAIPLPAGAITVIATGIGVIEATGSGFDGPIDEYGYFGPRGASLAGKAATITISVDLTATPPIIYPDGTQSVSSGYYNSYPGYDPERTADIGGGTITINDVTKENNGSASTTYSLRTPDAYICTFSSACVTLGASTGPGRWSGSDKLFLIAGGFRNGAPKDLLDVPTSDNLCTDVAECRGAFAFALSEVFSGTVRLSSLRFSTASVPEPSTWAMMILGFGAVGYAMRRKTALRIV
jgi:hypothetical protein